MQGHAGRCELKHILAPIDARISNFGHHQSNGRRANDRERVLTVVQMSGRRPDDGRRADALVDLFD